MLIKASLMGAQEEEAPAMLIYQKGLTLRGWCHRGSHFTSSGGKPPSTKKKR